MPEIEMTPLNNLNNHQPTRWQNGSEPPLNAYNLNKIEQIIVDIINVIKQNVSDITWNETNINNISSQISANFNDLEGQLSTTNTSIKTLDEIIQAIRTQLGDKPELSDTIYNQLNSLKSEIGVNDDAFDADTIYGAINEALEKAKNYADTKDKETNYDASLQERVTSIEDELEEVSASIESAKTITIKHTDDEIEKVNSAITELKKNIESSTTSPIWIDF